MSVISPLQRVAEIIKRQRIHPLRKLRELGDNTPAVVR